MLFRPLRIILFALFCKPLKNPEVTYLQRTSVISVLRVVAHVTSFVANDISFIRSCGHEDITSLYSPLNLADELSLYLLTIRCYSNIILQGILITTIPKIMPLPSSFVDFCNLPGSANGSQRLRWSAPLLLH